MISLTQHRRSPPARLALALSLLGLSFSTWAAASTPAQSVGEITLAVGQAVIVSSDGKSTPAQRGTPLYVGDRIETMTGGQAMVRFVDGGLISVRSGSRLTVDAYRYDSSKPQDSAIKFSLTQGVARSITGRGGEAARERFRLNTPIAAIGVKGTDFVVQAAQDISRVAVYHGAVVVAPFGGGCSADGTGPCRTPLTQTLADASGSVMLEVNRREAAPQIVPVAGSPLDTPAPTGEPKAGRRGPDDSNSSLRRNEPVADAVVNNLAANEANTPAPVVSPATLVWGRWSWSAKPAGDTLTRSANDLANTRGLEVTVGSMDIALFRPEVKEPLSADLGRVTLGLRDGAAFLQQGDTVSAGSVKSGNLSLDFTTWSFSTQLSITHPAVSGPVALQGSGQITSNGILNGRETGGGTIAGATNATATEAGYFFEKVIGAGTLTGMTLWKR